MVKKWEIYFANLDPVKGSEQKGVRPVLVISNDEINDRLPVCTVVPFTSYKEDSFVYPSELFLDKLSTGLSRDSILMFQQIRTIDQRRLKNPIAGMIFREDTRIMITKSLMQYFGIF